MQGGACTLHMQCRLQPAVSCGVQPGLLYATTENAMAAVAVAEATASATAAAAEAIPAAVVSTAVTTAVTSAAAVAADCSRLFGCYNSMAIAAAAVISSSAATKLLQLQSPQLPLQLTGCKT